MLKVEDRSSIVTKFVADPGRPCGSHPETDPSGARYRVLPVAPWPANSPMMDEPWLPNC